MKHRSDRQPQILSDFAYLLTIVASTASVLWFILGLLYTGYPTWLVLVTGLAIGSGVQIGGTLGMLWLKQRREDQIVAQLERYETSLLRTGMEVPRTDVGVRLRAILDSTNRELYYDAHGTPRIREKAS